MKSSMVKNFSWLLICSIIAKVLGGLYRIALTRILATDIGLYQMAFSVYSFLVILVSSGVPLAISKLVSGKKTENHQKNILNGAVFIFITIACVLAILILLGGKGIALVQGEEKLWLCYTVLAPSLLFSAGGAILRGYYQGKHNFRVSAISGIVEQMVRVLVGLVLMLLLRKFYVLGAVLGAVLGTLVGDVIAFVYLRINLKCEGGFKYSSKNAKYGKQIIKGVYPIMLYGAIMPFSNFVDAFLVVRLLGLNFPQSTSSLLYGLQSGVVSSIVSIPNIFSFALVSVMMPYLSKDYADKNINQFNNKVKLAFKLILSIGLPCAVFFCINSNNIINLLYGTSINGYGVNGQFVAKNLLIISSIGIVFSGINQISAIILQSINKKSIPIINLIIGLSCKLIIQLMFLPSKTLGVYAYSIAVVVGLVVSGVLNIYSVERYVGNMFEIKYLTKQFALAVGIYALLVVLKIFDSVPVFVLGSIFTVLIYFVFGYILKLFTKEDIKSIINTE